MDTAYLHIVTNHLPIIGIPFAVAVMVLGIWRKSDDLKSVAFLFLAVLGLVSIIVYLTGEPAEEVVENVTGVAENAIDAHEDFAVFALISALVTGTLSGIAFLAFKGLRLFIPGKGNEGRDPSYPSWVAPAILLLAVITTGMFAYTGKLGGMIRHTEFYGAAGAGESEEHEEHEEEEGRERSERRQNRGEG